MVTTERMKEKTLLFTVKMTGEVRDRQSLTQMSMRGECGLYCRKILCGKKVKKKDKTSDKKVSVIHLVT